MNNYYVERRKQVRNIEGASQRIQEDTMRFAAIMEGLGVAFVDSIMTLIAFLPVLAALSVRRSNGSKFLLRFFFVSPVFWLPKIAFWF